MGPAGGENDDPFAGWSLDDEFVRRAQRREATAEERLERLRRIDAEYRRLIDQRRAQVAADEATAAVRPRPGRGSRVLGVLFVVAVGVGVAWAVTSDGPGGAPAPAAGREPTGPAAERAEPDDGDNGDPGDVVGEQLGGTGAPDGAPVGTEASDVPLGAPAPLAATSDAYRFVKMRPDGEGPVAYDPCRQIHVAVNPRTAPSGGDALLTEALAEVGRATGLQFVVDGQTTAVPATTGPGGPGIDGGWDPVLVAWTDPAEAPALQGDVAGTGGSSWVELPSGAAVFVTGQVALDGPQLAEMLQLPNGRATVRAVIQHELAHVVGLDHVEDPAQLMHAVGQPDVVSFAPGDLTGLAELGRGECFPDL
jgi:hypothetical protein